MKKKRERNADRSRKDNGQRRDVDTVEQRFAGGRRFKESDIRVEGEGTLWEEAVEERKDVWVQDRDQKNPEDENGCKHRWMNIQRVASLCASFLKRGYQL